MIFENPDALWLMLVLPPLILGLGFWGWRRKREALKIFSLDVNYLIKKQAEKYAVTIVLVVLLILALALPKVGYFTAAATQKTGEIAFLVDVSRSMAAEKGIYSPNRLERVKPVLLDIIDSMEELGQVKLSLHGFTTIARSIVPFVGVEDYPYLRESIKKILDINCTPGEDTSFGQSIQNVVGKFSEGEHAKIIIIFSDGEPFYYLLQGMTYFEKNYIERATEDAVEAGVKIITVGMGEPEGAKIPEYDDDGEFTGRYIQFEFENSDYVSYLEEDTLKFIASRANGLYFSEKNLDGLINYITQNLDEVHADDINNEVKAYQPVAHWLLLASLPALVVLIKRHVLG